jgi:predicted  nucleic acid-binding Zn-ribbon protein|tara:strand:+ start:1265 stop:1615 length:351 start_codon:yes stop_codon:yes gene_type:complete
MDLENEIGILRDNIRELQKQLGQAHTRIGELMSEKSISSNEEVVKQKQFIQELTGEISKTDSELIKKIQSQMDSIPQVLDSRPPRPKLAKNEKYVSVNKDGNMVYLEEASKGILED